MCVDFAYKHREYKGKGWALRNIKLGMARRLIFLKGLLMCFKMYQTQYDRSRVKEELCSLALQKPLDLLVLILQEEGVSYDSIDILLSSYESYLEFLNDEEKRLHLKQISMSDAYEDPIFKEARLNSNRFRDTVHRIFINGNNKISEFTLKYAVF